MPEFKNPLTDPNITCGGKTLDQRAEELIRERKEQDLKAKLEKKKGKPKPGQQTSVINVSDYLLLKNISCVDSEDNVFEHYDEIYVAKDVVREKDDKGNFVAVLFTPYEAASYFEKQDLFLPSFALSCNILAVLFKIAIEKQGDSYQILDPEIEKVLQQYKDYYHIQNTLVEWGNKRIIHYPSDSDFPRSGGNDNINQARKRTALIFNRKDFTDSLLEEALKIPNFKEFVRNLTGLKNPEILVEIGEYFNRPAQIGVEDKRNTTRRVACLSYNQNFTINACVQIFEKNAACGVCTTTKNFKNGFIERM